MNTIRLVTILISTMGLLSFFKKSDKKNSDSNSPILGMILLEEPNSLNYNGMIGDLEKKWNLKIESKEIEKEALVININGYTIAIGNMPVAIPGDEIKITAEYNYLWKDGIEEAVNHKGHIILSIMNAGKDPIKENILFNQIAASILENSESIGIYIGGRTLLLKKEFYLANTESMSEEDLPLYNWIYFGLRQENGRQSVYTYGLVDFGKKEMEIVNSVKNFEELNEMIFNITHYVIAYDVLLNDGETIGVSATQKLKISESKGKFLEGKTLKIEY